MKIAIITSGLLPMPSVKDGAIETLLQYVIDYNEYNNNNINFDIYSIYDNNAREESTKYKNSKFIYVKNNKIMKKISDFVFKFFRKIQLYPDPNFEFQFIKNVFKLIKKNKYDYIIVESENHFADYVVRRTKIPVILYLHNNKLNNKTKNSEFISAKLYKIWTVSNYIKNEVLTIDKKLEKKTIVIYNGIDLKKFKNIKKVEHDGINYLYVGRIEKSKGVLELVRAFNNLNTKSKLYIVGGSFHSNNKVTKYYNEVKKISGTNVIFTGYVKNDELKNIYKNIDIQVVPSIWQEPAGLVNTEAICAGVGLIVSDVGGIREYINKNTKLVKCDKNFVNNLTEAMKNYDINQKKDLQFDLDFFSSTNYASRVIDEIKKLGE